MECPQCYSGAAYRFRFLLILSNEVPEMDLEVLTLLEICGIFLFSLKAACLNPRNVESCQYTEYHDSNLSETSDVRLMKTS